MVRFVFVLDSFEDFVGIFDGGFGDINFGKTPGEGFVLVEKIAVFGVRCRSDAADIAPSQRRLEDVACIHAPAASAACSHQCMDLVDEDDRIGQGFELVNHPLEALFKISAKFRPSHQCPHLQRINSGIFEDFGDGTFGDPECQSLGDSGFAHTGFSDEEGVVLLAAHQRLHHPLDLFFPTNHRIDFVILCQCDQLNRKVIEIGMGTFLFFFGVG